MIKAVLIIASFLLAIFMVNPVLAHIGEDLYMHHFFVPNIYETDSSIWLIAILVTAIIVLIVLLIIKAIRGNRFRRVDRFEKIEEDHDEDIEEERDHIHGNHVHKTIIEKDRRAPRRTRVIRRTREDF